MPELTAWEALPVAGAVRPDGAPRTLTGGWRTGEKPAVDVSLCVNCLLCWLYCPDSAVTLSGETFTGFDLDYCKGCGICADVCPVGCDRDGGRMSDRPASHWRRGRRARDAPGRSRRRSRLSDHAADADHPDVREARRGRAGEHGDRQRRVGALRHERCDRRRARGRPHDDCHLVTGARPDGGGRLHRRLDARADRDGARQPRALGADQHPLRPLGLDAHPGLRSRPALRGERPGGLRPDGDGSANRGGSARPAAGARMPRRLHDHAFRRAGLAPPRRRSHSLRRSLQRPEHRARHDEPDDAGAVRDARLLLRAAPPAGGRARDRPRRPRRGCPRLRADVGPAERRARGVPAGGRDARARRARLHRRNDQGRRRRAS